jgi:hypothetical protein
MFGVYNRRKYRLERRHKSAPGSLSTQKEGRQALQNITDLSKLLFVVSGK